jgi:hypothetical protein
MDKTKPFNFATSNIADIGNWTTYLINSDLSCALVYENFTNVFRFLKLTNTI